MNQALLHPLYPVSDLTKVIAVQIPLPPCAPPPLMPSDALYLDFDGTLAELATRPDAVRVAASLPALLARLYARQGGAVAVVTGRRLEQVDGLLAPLRLPGAGVHGAEFRLQDAAPLQTLDDARIASVLSALLELFGQDGRLLIEDKGAAAALHFRLAPERGIECIDAMRRLAACYALDILVGKSVVEAHIPGINKGAAVRKLSSHAPFLGRMPVFVGDDRTDENAFQVIHELGGCSVKVGSGPSIARYRLPAVSDVHHWLRRSF